MTNDPFEQGPLTERTYQLQGWVVALCAIIGFFVALIATLLIIM